MFCRVSKVTLEGPRYSGNLLPHLARLSDLDELQLVETSIVPSDLEAWRRQHLRVVVTATQRTVTQ